MIMIVLRMPAFYRVLQLDSLDVAITSALCDKKAIPYNNLSNIIKNLLNISCNAMSFSTVKWLQMIEWIIKRKTIVCAD